MIAMVVGLITRTDINSTAYSLLVERKSLNVFFSNNEHVVITHEEIKYIIKISFLFNTIYIGKLAIFQIKLMTNI